MLLHYLVINGNGGYLIPDSSLKERPTHNMDAIDMLDTALMKRTHYEMQLMVGDMNSTIGDKISKLADGTEVKRHRAYKKTNTRSNKLNSFVEIALEISIVQSNQYIYAVIFDRLL